MNDAVVNRGEAAEIVLQCEDFAAALDYYTSELGFRIDSIYPADSPRVAAISAFGIRVRLENGAEGARRDSTLPTYDPSLVVTKFDQDSFEKGRAGMHYRDLIPDRYGGRFIASHIRIPDGGPVPDYVHHHDIRFQMIFCVKGWARVVYEDQGEPMLMQVGDCFLQPPHIRHRVLECSDEMEVVEIGCPAEHETSVDHDMKLPTTLRRPNRDFGGQRFVFDKAVEATRRPWELAGMEYRDTGIATASDGVASAIVVRAKKSIPELTIQHNVEIRFLFVLHGHGTLNCVEQYELGSGDSCALPPGRTCTLHNLSDDFEFLDVMSPSRSQDR